MPNAFRKMLVELSPYIGDRELKDLKFYNKDNIEKRYMAGIESSVDLWEALEQRDLLGEKKIDILKEMLNLCFPQRRDVMKIVEDYERSVGLLVDDDMNVDIHQHQTATANANSNSVHVSSPKGNMKGDSSTEYNGPPELERCMRYLTDRMGRDWKFFMRALNLKERDMEDREYSNPRSFREPIYCCLMAWLVDNESKPSNTIIDTLKQALSSVGRNDLRDDLQDRKYENIKI